MTEALVNEVHTINIEDPPDALLGDDHKEPIPDDQIRDVWSMFSDVDQASGLKYSWLEIREVLMSENGVAKALPLIFEYYCEQNSRMDPYINYSLACSHFTAEELGDVITKSSQKRLLQRVKRLIQKQQNMTPLSTKQKYVDAE
jgi:hypothetical protein